MEKDIKFPKIWPGYILALLFLLFEVGEAILNPQASQEKYTWWTVLFWLIGLVYWCICVYNLHKTIFKITDSHYPITPGQAVGYGFIPFYNLYWFFKWPSEIIGMVNSRIGTKKFKAWTPGLFLLLFTLAGRVDGTIWLVGTFAVLSYLIRRIKISLTIQPEIMPYTDKITRLSKGTRIILICIILIPILALLAAIAIPNLLRARLVANESATEMRIRNISTAIENYVAANNGKYPLSEYELQPSYLTDSYDNKTLQGYKYALNLNPNGYEIYATPTQCYSTGSKNFKVTTGGIISKKDCK